LTEGCSDDIRCWLCHTTSLSPCGVYEDLWTATRVADLLHGEASRLRLEPPGDRGVGIEFEIDIAQVLGQRAREDPDRFARLALRFDATVPAVAIAHVIFNIRTDVDMDVLTDVCEQASSLYGEDVGREICSAAESIRDVNDRLVALIERHSSASDPDREWARTDADRSTPYFGGDLYHAGLNSTRGQAALDAAAALYSGSNYVDRLFPVVAHLAVDDNLGVRTCAAEAILALLNHDNDTALELAERLFGAPIDIFDSRTTERLLTYCVLRAPERFAAHLQRALDGPTDVATRAGRTWALAAFRDALAPPATDDVRMLPPPARVGAAEVLAENMADSAHQIYALFDDPDANVREAAARGMRNIFEVAPDVLNAIIERFADSAAFADHMDDLIHALAKLGTRMPQSTLRVCALAVDAGGRELGDIASARSIVGGDLTTVVLRLYRQGDEQIRAGCLDIVDRLTEINAHGIDTALADER
jgi:hypothetical protein